MHISKKEIVEYFESKDVQVKTVEIEYSRISSKSGSTVLTNVTSVDGVLFSVFILDNDEGDILESNGGWNMITLSTRYDFSVGENGEYNNDLESTLVFGIEGGEFQEPQLKCDKLNDSYWIAVYKKSA